ncbi:hypothetical protein TWF481_004172 [Arthrobotrys musiformis]|uniref:Uncharacterized protein n=1 Tax=Arthrobotrys musiformis TaxID=47236 RepID=A0AAV9WIR9_9PEZI
MHQDMLITLSSPAPSRTHSLPQPHPSLPPYTDPLPPQYPHSTRFELPFPPPSPQTPISTIHRSQTFLPALSDGSPPQYRHSLQTIDSANSEPAYILRYDAPTKTTILTTPTGEKLTSISFLKPRRQTVTTFKPSDADAETLTGSSLTLADDIEDSSSEGEEDENPSETLTAPSIQETPTKETITLSSHKYFRQAKGTEFTTKSGTSYHWQKSIPTSTHSVPSKSRNDTLPHSTFVLTVSPPKGQRTAGGRKIVGRINIIHGRSSKAILELKGEGREELSEAVFLGSAIAVLKKVELKATRQRAQRTLPQNVIQITF